MLMLSPAAGHLSQVLTAIAAKSYWGYPTQLLCYWQNELTILPESIQKLPTVVAEIEGIVVGFYQLNNQLIVWELEHLWVHPTAMRCGIGRTLLFHAAQYAVSAGQQSLLIDSDPHAELFYVRCGAKRVGEIPAPIEGNPLRILPRLILQLPR